MSFLQLLVCTALVVWVNLSTLREGVHTHTVQIPSKNWLKYEDCGMKHQFCGHMEGLAIYLSIFLSIYVSFYLEISQYVYVYIFFFNAHI